MSITGAGKGLRPTRARHRWPDEVDRWCSRPDWAEIPGGETLQKLLARTTAALHEVLRRHRDEVLVLVGHDSVNRVILIHALELPLSRYWHIRQSPCAINELDYSGSGFTIVALNQTDYLRTE
jgi:phosphoserine phosphatase